MNREEAKREILFAKRSVITGSWIDQAYDVAIQALSEPERKKGTWIEYIPEHGECPFCGNRVDLLGGKENNFCSECGAVLRIRESDYL